MILKNRLGITNQIELAKTEERLSNHKSAKSIQDLGFYELKRQLEYKSKQKGNKLFINDRWFASSKTCCNCGAKKEDLTLSDRTYYCDECKLEIDRDLNASINLHNQLGRVHPEVMPVKLSAMNLEGGLLNLTSSVKAGNKHQTQSVLSY